MIRPPSFFPFLACVWLAGCTSRPDAPVPPGQYQKWRDDAIDHVEILQTFHLSQYRQIVVLPFDGSGLALPADGSRTAVERTLGRLNTSFAEDLDNELPRRMAIKAVPGPASPIRAPGVLFLQIKFNGTGPTPEPVASPTRKPVVTARITMSGEITDAASGKVLARFSHTDRYRKHTLPARFYTTVLPEDKEDVAEAAAQLLKSYYP